MLLDLGRNDVGRVAAIGTVTVTDQFFVERYSQVMHIVSNVEGKLDPRYDALDALAAGFPAGTVSGAPKVRAMEIIDELEKEKRGLYAGCVGYFSAAGDMDSCIVLRTSWRIPIPTASSRSASTRPRRCSVPPRKRAGLRASLGRGSRAIDSVSPSPLGRGVECPIVLW